MSKDFFTLGFIKQAELYGLANSENIETFKKYAELNYDYCLDKTASLMPNPETVDNLIKALPLMVGANVIGAGFGSNYAPQSAKELKEELEYSENPSLAKYMRYLLPGYTGYRLAKENRLNHAYQNYLDSQNMQ
jgi:hypothetical protein